MEPIEFPEQTTIYGKNQPQYGPLPAHVDCNGVVTCCWKLTEQEIHQILDKGVIWHQVHTFGLAVQPQLLTTEKPELE